MPENGSCCTVLYGPAWGAPRADRGPTAASDAASDAAEESVFHHYAQSMQHHTGGELGDLFGCGESHQSSMCCSGVLCWMIPPLAAWVPKKVLRTAGARRLC